MPKGISTFQRRNTAPYDITHPTTLDSTTLDSTTLDSTTLDSTTLDSTTLLRHARKRAIATSYHRARAETSRHYEQTNGPRVRKRHEQQARREEQCRVPFLTRAQRTFSPCRAAYLFTQSRRVLPSPLAAYIANTHFAQTSRKLQRNRSQVSRHTTITRSTCSRHPYQAIAYVIPSHIAPRHMLRPGTNCPVPLLSGQPLIWPDSYPTSHRPCQAACL